MVFQIVSLDDRFFVHRIGVLADEQIAAIDEALMDILNLRNRRTDGDSITEG